MITANRSAFLQLPAELKINVLEQVSELQDLFNLCLTCRQLQLLTTPTLYRDVDILVPPDNTIGWNIGGVPLLREDVSAAVKSLTVRNCYPDIRQPACSRDQSYYGSIERLLHVFFERLPPRRLQTLSFMHQTPVTDQILRPLFEKQLDCLEELKLYDLKSFALPAMLIPTRLSSFECRNFADGENLVTLLQPNRRSLHTLRLGQEKLFVESYMRSRNVYPYPGHMVEPLVQLTLLLPLRELSGLRNLELFAVNLNPLLPSMESDLSFYAELQSLSLQSCLGAAEMLATLAHIHTAKNVHNPQQSELRLQHFSLRQEIPDSNLRSALRDFLGSFEGLESLSLLIENTTFLEKASNLIQGHGKTMKKLVLEGRIEPRQYLAHDTSRPFGTGSHPATLWDQSLGEICSLCPQLEELGTGFSLNDRFVRDRQSDLATLKRLNTLHIRNFPESSSVVHFGDYTIKQLAQKFVDETFPAGSTLHPPALNVLAIGPTLYESRWKVGLGRGPLPEYLKTHYFCVDWQRNRFGCWLPLLTSVSEKSMENLRHQRPLSGIFESIWIK